MTHTMSQLLYARIEEGTGSPRVITLHKHNQYARAVSEYGRAASPAGRVISLEAYKGVYSGRDVVGYTWFIGPFAQPSPLYFGDALAEIERFLWDEVDRQDANTSELPYLVGVEQGGIMAIASAAAVPDLLSGVIAIDGFLPIVPGWDPPLAPLEGLPILLINDPQRSVEHQNVLSGDRLVDTLTTWGADVTVLHASSDEIPGTVMSGWLDARTPRFMQMDQNDRPAPVAASSE